MPNHCSSLSEKCLWVHWLRVVYDGRQLDGVNGVGAVGWHRVEQSWEATDVMECSLIIVSGWT